MIWFRLRLQQVKRSKTFFPPFESFTLMYIERVLIIPCYFFTSFFALSKQCACFTLAPLFMCKCVYVCVCALQSEYDTRKTHDNSYTQKAFGCCRFVAQPVADTDTLSLSMFCIYLCTVYINISFIYFCHANCCAAHTRALALRVVRVLAAAGAAITSADAVVAAVCCLATVAAAIFSSAVSGFVCIVLCQCYCYCYYYVPITLHAIYNVYS